MNWKQEAIEKLKNYEGKRTALENIPEEIYRLELALSGLPKAAGGESISQVEDKEQHTCNLVCREELKRALKQARIWVKTVDRALATLSEEERLVLRRVYICQEKGNVDRLCEELHLEKASVYRRRDAALRQFTIALYGGLET